MTMAEGEKIEDGGPAFPHQAPMLAGVDENGNIELLQGSNFWRPGNLSVRDYFAAAALQGLLANGNGPTQPWVADGDQEPVATLAYMAADALLAARKAGKP